MPFALFHVKHPVNLTGIDVSHQSRDEPLGRQFVDDAGKALRAFAVDLGEGIIQ